MSVKESPNPRIRWMIRRDMPAVLEIEKASFEYAWAEEDFFRVLRQQNCIGMVAEIDDTIVAGYMIYELQKGLLNLLNFAVENNEFRRVGIGTAMVKKLKSKLSERGRKRITTVVRETNYQAQMFFKAMGFLATGIAKRPYDDTDEQGYQFQFDLVPEKSTGPGNRISGIQTK